MTNPFRERRTRSQIKLSDDILKVPQHSPMKNARSAMIVHSESPGDMDTVEDSEDELLLSPNKPLKPSRSKRSVSPPPKDEYSSGASEEKGGRELKRMKWDLGQGERRNPTEDRLVTVAHARTNSEPNAGPSRKLSHKRAGTVSSNTKPNSTSNVPISLTAQSSTGAPGKTRAQSVPLFPSFSSLPSLDLRNPPLSPLRARSSSRSPDRHHGLKVHLSPPKPLTPELPTHAEAVPVGSKISMEVDVKLLIQPIAEIDTVIRSVLDTISPIPELPIQPPRSLTLTPPALPNALFAEHPVTPVPSGLGLSMSPLTPLPETPLPPGVAAEGEDRYDARDGWGFNKGSDISPPLQPIPQPDFGNPKDATDTSNASKAESQSQIPRQIMGPPPQPLDTTTLTSAETENAKQPPPKMATPKGLSSSSSTNAFSLLMENAARQGRNKPQDKGGGKGISSLPQVVGLGNSNDTKGKGRVEPDVKKVSLKDRMRRKKPKPAVPTKFVPVIFDDDEDQEEVPELESKQIPVEPEGKIWLSSTEETMPQEKPDTPTPPVPEEPPAVGPITIPQRQVAMPTETETETILPQLRSPSPISSMTSLSDSALEPTGLTKDKQGPAIPPSVVPEERTEEGGQEQLISTPVAVELKQMHDPMELERSGVEVQTEAQTPQEAQPTPQVQDPSAEETPQSPKPRPTARKRSQSNIPTSSRITRSAVKPPPPAARPTGRRAQVTTGIPRKYLSSTTAKRTLSSTERASTEAEDRALHPGSPMQTSSPLRTPSRGFRTPGSSPAKISLARTPSKPNFSTEGSPSPTKLARAVSMFSRPSGAFAADDIGIKSNGSSLSTLSNALEKLKMPAPSRPNTSLGFNPANGKDGDGDGDVLLSEQRLRPSDTAHSTSRPRSLTVGHGTVTGSAEGSSSTQAEPSMNKARLVQKPMTSFFTKSGSSSSMSTNPRSAKNQLLGAGKPTLYGAGVKAKGAFGVGGLSGAGGGLFPMANKRLVQKVSKKSSLPVVAASPVKGSVGGTGRDFGIGDVDDSIIVDDSLTTDGEKPSDKAKDDTVIGGMGDISITPLAKRDAGTQVVGTSGNADKPPLDKDHEKEKQKVWQKDSSRRASLALSQLSQSLSAGPAYGTSGKGSMGPPATPRKIARSASSSYPAPSHNNDHTSATATSAAGTATSSKSSTSPGKAPPPTGTRFSARQAAKVVLSVESKSPLTSTGPGGTGKKTYAEKDKGAKNVESLRILSDCVIFVDVKTDDGEEAGSLFLEMLEGLGAKILARVGQTCTHVIFKNGLMSTISRYRLLRDPKPSVVGIAWVVDCVEQRQRVEEGPYLIDLNEINVAGTTKRRRSMLPKLISGSSMEFTPTEVDPEEGGGDADVSMDGSTSSLTLDDDLTPLERARRRRSMIFGPPA